MRISRSIVAALFTISGVISSAQTQTANPNTKLSDGAFQTLAQSCGANVQIINRWRLRTTLHKHFGHKYEKPTKCPDRRTANQEYSFA